MTNLDEATTYLEGLINYERRASYALARMGLEPIRRLLDRVGNPHAGLSILHVAGSKGKGSTCLFAEAILAAAGERVGTFTSPHLESWTERFRIAGRPVQGRTLAAAVETLRPHVDALRRTYPDDAPTFFDATTAAALLLFAEAGVDRAILEVGLGGRLDSTNVVTPAVTCVTSIELEHTEKLGDSLAAIAAEKAGILKPGIPCVMGSLPDEAASVVRARAAEVGAPLVAFGADFDAEPTGGVEEGMAEDTAGWGLRYHEADGFELGARIQAPGSHQVANAAMAVAVVRRLHRDQTLGPEEIQRGLSRARLPGRIEICGRRPWIVVDSAHTERSARSLMEVVERIPARARALVLSVSAGKNLPAILDALLPGADRVTVTQAEPLRSLHPDELAEAIRARRPQLGVDVVPDPEKALCGERDRLAPDELLCVTGSIYLAGVARRVLGADD